MPERQDHNRADALDAGRTAINLEMRRYTRRLKSSVEAKVNELFDKAQAEALPFDFAEAAQIAVVHARTSYFAGELPAGESDAETTADE